MFALSRHALIILPVAATFLLSSCSEPGPHAVPTPSTSITFGAQDVSTPATASGTPVVGPTIDINDFAFAPASLTVPVGSTVIWTNKDGEPHTVVANDGSFRSPAMDTNGVFSFTFATAGSFDYVCSIHPFMHGTVVVTK